MKNTVLLGAILIAAAVTHTGIFLLGRAVGKPAGPPHVAAVATCDAKTNSSKEDRNTVWTVLNTVTSRGDIAAIPPSGAKMVGMAIAMMVDADAPPQIRQNGLNGYFGKSQFSFSEAEQQELMTGLRSDVPAERAKALSRIVAADAASADLAKAVLADSERLQLFMTGKPVALEQ